MKSRFEYLAVYSNNVQFCDLKGVPSKKNPTKIITRAIKDCKFLIKIQGRFFNLSIFSPSENASLGGEFLFLLLFDRYDF